MKNQTQDEIRLNVWLYSDSKPAQSGIFCFREQLLLEKRTNVMVHSTRCGGIGVKEVIDALRLAPDEGKKVLNGRDRLACELPINANESIQIRWTPRLDTYEFFMVVEKDTPCRQEMDAPPKWGKPFLILHGLSSCSPVIIRRMDGNANSTQTGIQIMVAETCTDIRDLTDRSTSSKKH